MKLRGQVRLVPVHHGRRRGDVAQRLLQAGWPAHAVRAALRMTHKALARALSPRDAAARVFSRFGRAA